MWRRQGISRPGDVAQSELDAQATYQLKGLDGPAGFILGAGQQLQRRLGRADADHRDGPRLHEREQLQRRRRHDAQRALSADQELLEIIAGVVFAQSLEAVPDLAVGQDRLQPQHLRAVLGNPAAIDNPFFRLFPSWGVLPMVVLAAMATVIASQAVISGAFSLTAQAMRMGYLPRMRVIQTSGTAIGQIYVPTVNWLLMVGVLLLVLGFRSSGALSAAYGIAVSITMVTTTLLA
eukprot:gene49567-66398_t